MIFHFKLGLNFCKKRIYHSAQNSTLFMNPFSKVAKIFAKLNSTKLSTNCYNLCAPKLSNRTWIFYCAHVPVFSNCYTDIPCNLYEFLWAACRYLPCSWNLMLMNAYLLNNCRQGWFVFSKYEMQRNENKGIIII